MLPGCSNVSKCSSVQLKSKSLSGILAKKVVEVKKAKSILIRRLSEGSCSSSVCQNLQEISALINANDYKSALHTLQPLISSSWSEHKEWLKPLKTALLLGQRAFQ